MKIEDLLGRPILMVGGPKDGEIIVSELYRIRVMNVDRRIGEFTYGDSYYTLTKGNVTGPCFGFECAAYVHESVERKDWVRMWFGKILAIYMMNESKVQP